MANKIIQSLDAKYYTDPAIFDVEKEKIFFKTWQFIAHESEIANPGDYLTRRIVDQEIIIVRGNDKKLRAFYNVCAHRAHTLLKGEGNCPRLISCPYHAWTYNLDGSLRAAPNQNNVEGFDPANIKLSAINLEVFCGFIFVNLDPAAASLEAQSGDLKRYIESFIPEHGKLRFLTERRMQHDCGWKVSIENFNECYHCKFVHKALREKVLEIDTYRTVAEGIYIRHFCEGRDPSETMYNYDPKNGGQGANMGAFFIWPNVAIVCYPGGIVSVRHFIPIVHRQTIYSYRWYSDGQAAEKDIYDLADKHFNTNGAEDAEVVNEVQKGLESRGYGTGPLMIDREHTDASEHGVLHLQKLALKSISL